MEAGLANLVDRHEPRPKPRLSELIAPDRTVGPLTQEKAGNCRNPSLNIVQWPSPAIGRNAAIWFVRGLR